MKTRLLPLFLLASNFWLPASAGIMHNTEQTDVLTASLGRSIALAYGRHLVGGNVILKDETDQAQTIAFIALGDTFGGGEWDALEELLVNGNEVDITLPENYQFHKGLTGQLSAHVNEQGQQEVLYPEGVGSIYPFDTDGDQKVDALTPPGIQGLTFSRTAYLALRIPFDVFAPSPDLSVVGVYRTRKVRIFNAGGVQTDYKYSDNPAWQIADLLTVIRGLADSRIDWASFVASADYADALIDPVGDGSQVKRFVSHVAFTEEVDFDQAMEALLATCRGFLLDTAGTIKLRIDQARTSVFDFNMDNIVEGSAAGSPFTAWYKETRATANRLELMFRDLDNDFQVMTKLWNHEPQQGRTKRVIPAKLHLGNMPQHQAERLGNYLLTKAIDNNLFCRFTATISSFKVMPGDVVRVKYDAAPWAQSAAGDALYETFEVIETAEDAEGTREFLCQLYRSTTYPDTAGPTQNLIGTTVLRRPAPPPIPLSVNLATIPRGQLWLEFKTPVNADYREGNLELLAEDELQRVTTTLVEPMIPTDTGKLVTSSTGFLVGDYIAIGQEVLRIVGPGVMGAEPTATAWQLARAQKLTLAGTAASGDVAYRLSEKPLHFVLTPGFSLARAGKKHTVGFRPGRLRILYAALRMVGLGGNSAPVELPFWATWDIGSGSIPGSLPGLRVAAGGVGLIEIPGPLATGTDLAMPLILPEDVALSWVYATMGKSPAGGAGVGIQLKLDEVNWESAAIFPPFSATYEVALVINVGAKRGNVGLKRLSVEITQVGATSPGEDLIITALF